MQIDIAPETERLVREAISSGRFRSADEVIKAGVEALREKNAAPQPENLFDLLTPARGALTDEEIDQYFSRNPSPGRHIDLG